MQVIGTTIQYGTAVIAKIFLLLLLLPAMAEAGSLPEWPSIFNPARVLNFNIKIRSNDFSDIVADRHSKIEVPALFWASQDGDESDAILVSIGRKSGPSINGKVSFAIDINEFDDESPRAARNWKSLKKLELENGHESNVLAEGVAWTLHKLAKQAGISSAHYLPGLANWATLTVHLAPACREPCDTPFEFGETEAVVPQGVYLNVEYVDAQFLRNRDLWESGETWLYEQRRNDKVKVIEEGCEPEVPKSPAVRALQCSPFVKTKKKADAETGGNCDPSLIGNMIDMDVMLGVGAVHNYLAVEKELFQNGRNFYWADFSRDEQGKSCEKQRAMRVYFPGEMGSAFGKLDQSVYAQQTKGEGKLTQTPYQRVILSDVRPDGFRKLYNQKLLGVTSENFIAAAKSLLDDLEPILTPHLVEDPNSKIGDDPAKHFAELRSWLDKRAEVVRLQVCEDDQALCDSPQLAFKRPHPTVETHLYAIQQRTIRLDKFVGKGGAIEPLGENLLFITPRGRIGLVYPSETVVYLDDRVPMNEKKLMSGPVMLYPKFKARSLRFRVTDVLLREKSPEQFEIFVSHHYYDQECMELRISSTMLQIGNGNPHLTKPWRTVYRAKPCIPITKEEHAFVGHEAGGRMLFDGEEDLLIVIGDHALFKRRADRPLVAMDANFDLGKLLKINIDSGSSEILSSGLRNPQGLARDSQGNLWESEHGPQAGDEINILLPGANYGWPKATYGIKYGNKIWPLNPTQGRHEGYTKPVFSWIPSIAPSNIVFSDSPNFALWQGDLLLATLKARSLFRIRVSDGRAIYVEKIPLGVRMRDIAKMSNGSIAVLADSAKVIFLERSLDYCSSGQEDNIYRLDCEESRSDFGDVSPDALGSRHQAEDNSPDPVRAAIVSGESAGSELFDEMCASCHSLFGEHDVGPHLVGVMGRRPGSVPDYGFSPELASFGNVWTEENLMRFLLDPAEFAPGTKMPAIEISKAEAVAVTEFLGALSDR
jgi:glucose/arabinose dehydrogenase/cytochrome c2